MWKYWWYRPTEDGFENKTAYLLGWYCTTMPTRAVGLLSYNTTKGKPSAKYIIGKESAPRTLYGHNGVTDGYMEAVWENFGRFRKPESDPEQRL